MKKTLWKYAAYLVVFIFVLNMIAHFFYWYVSIAQFDMWMHTLGGVFLALFAGALWSRKVSRLSIGHTIAFVLGFVIVVGVGWEVFEYIVQYLIKGSVLAHFADSVSDLVCDIVGGVIGLCFVLRAKARYNSR